MANDKYRGLTTEEKALQVKKDYLLSEYLVSNGYDLKSNRNGTKYDMAECPFCGDTDSNNKGNISILLGKDNTEYIKCFKCSRGGDIFAYLKKDKDLNFYEAIKHLTGEDTTIQAPTTKKAVKPIIVPPKKVYDFTEVMNEAHEILLELPLDQTLFAKRGISLDIIKKFKLGFCTSFNIGFEDYPELQMVKEDKEGEKKDKEISFIYRYLIPIQDESGVVNIMPRLDNTMLEQLVKENKLKAPGTTWPNGSLVEYPKIRNLTGVESIPFNLHGAMKENDNNIFVCEGWCDALSLETLGYNAIALNGVVFINKFIRKIKNYDNYKNKTYILCMDNDKAGIDATEDLKKRLEEENCKAIPLKVDYGSNKDINDLLLNNKIELEKGIKETLKEVEQESQLIASQGHYFSNVDNILEKDTIFICDNITDSDIIKKYNDNVVTINNTQSPSIFISKLKTYKDYESKFYILSMNETSEIYTEIKKYLESNNCKIVDFNYNKYELDNHINNKDIEPLKANISSILNTIEEEKNNLSLVGSTYSKMDSILKRFEYNKNREILSTGFEGLNKAIGGGLYPGLYVLGGISGLGKTSLALNIAENIAENGKEDILFISLEMSLDDLTAKGVSRYIRKTVEKEYDESHYPVDDNYPSQKDIFNGALDLNNQNHLEGLHQYTNISKQLYIVEANDKHNCNIIRQEIINHKTKRNKYPILVVDYLQVMACSKDYTDEKRNIDFNITELKRISRDYNIPVIVISSVNRQYYKKAIDYEGFKASGNIEYTADVVIGLQYTFMNFSSDLDDKTIKEKYEEAKKSPRKEISSVILKNRNGVAGSITNFIFESKYNYFKEV